MKYNNKTTKIITNTEIMPKIF